MSDRITWFFIILVVTSFAARLPLIHDRPLLGYVDNEDAASHVLATMSALAQTDSQIHHYLPIFTLGSATDKNVDNLPTASARDIHGNYYYTSFPPLGFLVPHVAFKILDVKPSATALRYFNSALHALSLVLIGAIAISVVMRHRPRQEKFYAAMIMIAIYACAVEALKSHTISYWHHQLYQPIFYAQILVFFLGSRMWLFYILTFLVGFIEWTAFVANLGFALVSWFGAPNTAVFEGRRRALFIIAITALSGSILILWYASIISIPDYVAALAQRASVRSGAQTPIEYLLDLGRLAVGYLDSLGISFSILAIAFIISMAKRIFISNNTPGKLSRTRLISNSPRLHPLAFANWLRGSTERQLIFVMLVPLLENLIMLGHAVTYTFDRLKLVALVALLAVIFTKKLEWSFSRVASITVVAGYLAICEFWIFYGRSIDYSSSPYSYYVNLGTAIADKCAPGNVVYLDQSARGHHIFYTNRNIVHVDIKARNANADLADLVAEDLRMRKLPRGCLFLTEGDATPERSLGTNRGTFTSAILLGLGYRQLTGMGGDIVRLLHVDADGNVLEDGHFGHTRTQ